MADPSAPPPAGQAKPRSRWRWLLFALVAPLLLALIAVGVVLIALQTGPGERLAAKIAGDKVSGLLNGALRVGRIELKGTRTCFHDVALDDPQTGPVLTADEVCVDLAALALPKKLVDVRSVEIVHPSLDLAFVTEPDGTKTNTLSRALAARIKQPSSKSGPLQWVIELDDFDLSNGEVTLRPAPREKPTLAIGHIEMRDAKARYAQDGALVKTLLTAQLVAPGELPARLKLDATLEGAAESGKLKLAALEVALGETGLTASGHFDLGARVGELQIASIRVTPADLQKLMPGKPPPLAGEVRGKGELKSDGKRADLRLSLEAGKGKLEILAGATLKAEPNWSVKVQAYKIDPAALSRAAPAGQVTLALEAHGKGVPAYDEQGPRGELEGKLHVGPAQLTELGPVSVDLDARLHGRKGLLRAFTATALGLRLAAHGDAALNAVDLATELDAPDLAAVARAIGAFTKKPPIDLGGSAHLVAQVHGKPLAPDAELHLRVPRLVKGDSVDVLELTADGALRGDLKNPRKLAPTGKLVIAATNARIGDVELGAPRMQTDVMWPAAELNLVAQVLGGQMQLRGRAELDEDRDGLRAPVLTLSYPGNELKLRSPIAVHFRPKATVIEPFWLEGEHGGLGLSATLHRAPKGQPSAVDALVQLDKLDLAHLPQFALPPDLGLAGRISGKASIVGKQPHPIVDADLQLQGGAFKRVRGVDLKLSARLVRDRLTLEADGGGPAGVKLGAHVEAPLGSPKLLPASAPLHGVLTVRDVDLASAAELAGQEKLVDAHLRGVASLRVSFEGTLGNPTAAGSLHLAHLSMLLPRKGEPPPDEGAQKQPEAKGAKGLAGALGAVQAQVNAPKPGQPALREADLELGFSLKKGQLEVDGRASLGGGPAQTLVAHAPFEAMRALHEPKYLGQAQARPLTATLTLSDLDLGELAAMEIVPRGTAGKLSGALKLEGTPLDPKIALTIDARGLQSGKLSGLDGRLGLEMAQKIELKLAAGTSDGPLADLDVALAVSAKEWTALRRLGDPRKMAEAIADRKLSGRLSVPGVQLKRLGALVGKERLPGDLDGRLTGKVDLAGTPAAPQITGGLDLDAIRIGKAQALGKGSVYVEGGPDGATAHIDLSPPKGGTFLGHAFLKADLTAKNLLENGMLGVMQGQLDGHVSAKKFDLSVASGFGLLRRAEGTLDADVALSGLLGHLTTQGAAQLRNGLFDVVGQGVFHHVAFDSSFSPKEIVLDRLTGMLGYGTFSAIVVVMNRGSADDDGSKVEFTGELHLGDDESVRDLKDDGKPRAKRSVPIRQAAVDFAELYGEADLFGSYEGSLLTVNTKIADAAVHILARPSKKLQSSKPDKDVILVHPGEKPHPPGMEPEEVEAEERARKAATFRAQLTLEVERLYVHQDNVFEMPIKANVNVEYDARHPEAPTADGTVRVPNGSFQQFGRRFEIENAVITETGGDIADPELEIKARYEKGSTVVNIGVSGTAKDPIIDLTSNPPMDQDAIAFFLATGRVQGRATQNGGGVDLSSAATSIGSSFLFGKIQDELSGALPIDVLSIEASSSTGVAQASVGKYIGDSLFIGYRQRLTPAPNENTSEGRIEYDISRQVQAEATVGDQNSDLSILWSKDF